MDRLLCGDVGYGKTEVALRAVMKCVLDGKQAAILVPTTVLAQQHYLTAMQPLLPSYPVKIDVLSAASAPPAQMQADPAGAGGRHGGHAHRHPPAASEGRAVQGSGPAGRGRGAALRRHPQGAAQGDRQAGGRAHPVRHPHPPDAEHGPVRHPGHVHHRGAAPRTASRCRPTCWSTTGACWPTPCAGSWSGAGRCTTSTTGWRPSSAPPPASRRCWATRCSVAVAHGKMSEEELSDVMSQHGRRARWTCWCAPPSSRQASTSPTSTPSSSRTPTSWALPSSTRSGAGWAAPPAGPTPT